MPGDRIYYRQPQRSHFVTSPLPYPACRICYSPLTAHIRDVRLRYLKGTAPLFYCIDCESLTFPNVFNEPDAMLQEHAQWHVSVEERNTRWSNNLLNAVLRRRPVASIIEVGCATGTLLSVAKSRGIEGVGFDLNRHAVRIGRQRHSLDLRDTLWTANTLAEKWDLVCCI